MELVKIRPGRLRIIPWHLWGEDKWLLGGNHRDEFAAKRRQRLPLNMLIIGLPHGIHTAWWQKVKSFFDIGKQVLNLPICRVVINVDKAVKLRGSCHLDDEVFSLHVDWGLLVF